MMVLYHVTTEKKVQRYRQTGAILSPVRGFSTLQAASAWAMKVNRTVILKVEGKMVHKLPDHRSRFGEAFWIDEDVKRWECVVSPKKV